MTRRADLSPEQFTLLAISRLKKSGYAGIHTVYSGFNAAFREYFSGEDPVEHAKRLAAEGKIISRPTRGGAFIGLVGELKPSETAAGALKKMGI